jgi:hypothetical protein
VGLHADEGDVHLQGAVAEQAQDLCLCHDLRGHQVEHGDAQGADVLVDRALPAHDENVLLREDRPGGKVVGDADGHRRPPCGE